MTLNTQKLGWIVAAALAGVMSLSALSGFQNTTPKFATVDIEKVFAESKLRETNSVALQTAGKSRENVLTFLFQNRAMENADAQKYAELAVKEKPTPTETQEIARLKAAAEEATRKHRDLMTKKEPTDAEKTQMTTYASNVQAKQAFLGRLEGEYQNQIRDMQGDLRQKTLDRVTEVVRGLAAKQGFTVVFNTSAAPYASNDLTPDALKALK
ncbi:OmpH family outer membrane protein [bacterium]|nr:MAG: OmpH family outer membrane protein [bacterium]